MYTFSSFGIAVVRWKKLISFKSFHFRVIDFSSVASCTIDFSGLNYAEY